MWPVPVHECVRGRQLIQDSVERVRIAGAGTLEVRAAGDGPLGVGDTRLPQGEPL